MTDKQFEALIAELKGINKNLTEVKSSVEGLFIGLMGVMIAILLVAIT